MSAEEDARLTTGDKLRYGAEAVGFFFLMGVFKMLGLDAASALGGFIGREILYRTPISERARENLRTAYPEKTAAEIENIVRGMWDNLGRTVSEYPHLHKISSQGPKARIELLNVERAEAAAAPGKGVLFFSGHFGNWEVMPAGAAEHGFEGATVYRPVNNPYVDRWIVKQRLRAGSTEMVSKGPQGTRRIFTLLRRGKAAFLLVDQKTNEGVAAPFFGHDAMTTPAPAGLALRMGAALVRISNERLKGARFRMRVNPAIRFTPTGNYDEDVRALTARINREIEEAVRENPSQWLWIHRRWPREKDKPTGRRERAAQAALGDASRAEREGSNWT
ncbi:MAG TPA: lysophospholipid acyltransferase family protein [Rhizomicrobium sp.]|jgi:KDO2-lipid IV(A) lauroyltransferase